MAQLLPGHVLVFALSLSPSALPAHGDTEVTNLTPPPKTETQQFQLLATDLDLALSSKDVYAIMHRGEEIRAFHLPRDLPQPERQLWRHEKLELWLTGVQGVRAALDPEFDPHDQPSLNIAPMAKEGVGSNSGMDSRSIKDDAVRAEYEQRIAANENKAATQTYQLTLRRLNTEWTNELKNHVTSQYTSAPADVAEINALIDRHIPDVNDRASLREFLFDEFTSTAVSARQ